MPFGLSDARATLTIDASGFVSGVQQAAASLDALDASGSRSAQSSALVETQLRSVAAALGSAGNQGRGYEQALNSAAAAAGSAAAKVDALAIKTEAARAAMADAQQSVAQSAAQLQVLQEALEIDNTNITQVQAELDALGSSGSATNTEIMALEQTLAELRADAAALEGEISRETQSIDQNGEAAARAASKYNVLLAQLRQAETAADKADGKLSQLTGTINATSGIGAIAQNLGTWGTSTLTSASRSLSSMAVSAMNLTSGTVSSTLATDGLSAALRTLTKLAGPYGVAISGAAALASVGVQKLRQAWDDTHDIAGAMQDMIDNASDNSYTAALKNVNLELDEYNIKTQINKKLQKCFDTLTDGKADTPKIVTQLHTDVDEEYAGIRAQVEQYFVDAIQGAETEAAKAALIEKQNEITGSIDATQAAVNALVDSYAGKSTETCKAAREEIDAVQQLVNDLIDGINTAKALLDSQYGGSYAKVSGGYYATEQDIEWSLTYIQADKTNAEAQAKKEYEAAIAALNDAFRGKDGGETLEVEYQVDGVSHKLSGTFDDLTRQLEGEYQGALDIAQNEMIARWNAMLAGLAQSRSMGGEATAAFSALADAVDVKSVMSAIAGKISDGSFTAGDLGNLGADFWGKLGSVLSLDGADAQSAFGKAMQLSPAAALAMLGQWENGINAAITSGIGTMDGTGFGELFAAAIESGLFEGIDGIDMEGALARMQTMVGKLPVEELPVQVAPEITDDPFDMPIAVDEPIQANVEPQFALPSPEELNALYGDTVLPGPAIEPEITLPSPEELAALDGVTAEFSATGSNAGSAFVSALRGYIGPAATAGAAIAAAALAAMKARLNIHSPSRATFKMGLQTGEGFSLGIQERAQMARESMQRMANAAIQGAKSTQNINNSRSVTINLNGATIRSDDDVRKLARAMGRYTNDLNYGLS